MTDTNASTPPPGIIPDAETNHAADATANGAKKPGDAIGNLGKGIGDMFSHPSFGGILGIVLGGLGAFLLGHTFAGGGIFGTIVSVCLAPILIFLGSKAGHSIIDPMLHGASGIGNRNPGATPGQAPQIGLDPTAPPMQPTGYAAQNLYNAGAFPPSATLPPGCTFSNVCSTQLGGFVPYQPYYYGPGTNFSAFAVIRTGRH